MKRIPSMFISHGPPSVVLTDLPAVRLFQAIPDLVPKPRAILVISAHFEAYKTLITSAPKMNAIHDFGGPQPLFSLSYSVKGDPALADKIMVLLQDAGLDPHPEKSRGLDHGAWIPLLLAYPERDVPVLQLSIESNESPQYHYEMGKAITSVRDEGVLILGSGGAVHNLDDIHNYDIDAPPTEYASAFDYWLELAINGGNVKSLLNYEKEAPYPALAHPYPAEHFLPMFVPLGAAGDNRRGLTVHKSFLYGCLSMAAYMWE